MLKIKKPCGWQLPWNTHDAVCLSPCCPNSNSFFFLISFQAALCFLFFFEVFFWFFCSFVLFARSKLKTKPKRFRWRRSLCYGPQVFFPSWLAFVVHLSSFVKSNSNLYGTFWCLSFFFFYFANFYFFSFWEMCPRF